MTKPLARPKIIKKPYKYSYCIVAYFNFNVLTKYFNNTREYIYSKVHTVQRPQILRGRDMLIDSLYV